MRVDEELRKRVLGELKELGGSGDAEVAHWEADKLLLECIADKEISDAFLDISRCYS